MAKLESIVCPASGQPCEFNTYCASLKDTVDDPATDDLGLEIPNLTEGLPEPVRSTIDGEWCSTKRLANLGALAAESPTKSIERNLALILHGRITAGREMFYSPPRKG